MANDQLNEYIQKARQSGMTDEQIRGELKKGGWKDVQIDKAIVDSHEPSAPKSHVLKFFLIVLSVVVLSFAILYINNVRPWEPEPVPEQRLDPSENEILYPEIIYPEDWTGFSSMETKSIVQDVFRVISAVTLLLGMTLLITGILVRVRARGSKKNKHLGWVLVTFGILMIGIYLAMFSLVYFFSSFGKGTEILTPSGTVQIENLQTGDPVISLDLESGLLIIAYVKKTRERTVHEYYVLNEELVVTAEHPLAVMSNSQEIIWKRVKDISVGDVLFGLNSLPETVKSIYQYSSEEDVSVYNPEISEPHNYFVIIDGKAVLVHNKTVV